MNEFTISSRITAKEYAKFFLIGYYKKPVTILLQIISLYLIFYTISTYLSEAKMSSSSIIFTLVVGIVGLALPWLITAFAKKQYLSNRYFQNDTIFTFTEEGVEVKGVGHESSFVWAHVLKVQEKEAFLLLFHSKKLAHFVVKSKLTPEQIEFIKSKVKNA